MKRSMVHKTKTRQDLEKEVKKLRSKVRQLQSKLKDIRDRDYERALSKWCPPDLRR